MSLLEQAYDFAERKGYMVAKHPTGTVTVKNFREYMLLFPQKDGSVICEVREPMYEPSTRVTVTTEFEIKRLIGELR